MDDDVLRMRFEAIEKCLFANGRPGLEDRMRAMVEERITHKINNVNQFIDLKVGVLERKGDERHEENKVRFAENGKKTDKLTWIVAVGFGIVVAAQYFLPHWAK